MPDLKWLTDREHHYPFTRPSYSRRPEVGELIARDGEAWRVLEVNDLIPGDWSDDDQAMWRQWNTPDPATWARRPFEVIVVPHDQEGKTDKRWRMVVHARNYTTWNVLPEHYAVCVTCGTLAPCDGLMHEAQTQRSMAQVEKNLSVMDGACPGCNEPFTPRQLKNAHTFPGDNLLNPLGKPWVAFHDRYECRVAAAAYEEKWVAAEPGRERSLLTLRCTGTLVVHHDGTGECRGRNDGTECPHIYARHGRHTACYALSHGCGQGCDPQGHPGRRLARGLTKDGHRPEGLL